MTPADQEKLSITHQADVGPVLVGRNDVVWGERHGIRGDLRIVRRTGTNERVVWRVPAPSSERQSVLFQGVQGGLAASRHWLAGALVDGEQIDSGADDVSATQTSGRVLVSHDGGPTRRLFTGCNVGFVVAEADRNRLAVAQSNGSCGTGSTQSTVGIVDPSDGFYTPLFTTTKPTQIVRVALAGDWLAWSDDRSIVTMRLSTRETGRTVSRGSRDFDINAAGDLAYVRNDVLRIRRADGRVHVLSRNAFPRSPALSKDRIAWVGERQIHTATLTGRSLGRYGRFNGYKRQVRGSIDLRGHRLAFSISGSARGSGDPIPGGPGRLRVVTIP